MRQEPMNMYEIFDVWDAMLRENKDANPKPKIDSRNYTLKPYGKLDNPIDPSTAGKDQDPMVTQNFTVGEALYKLNDTKVALEELERALHASELGLNKTPISVIREKIQKCMQDIDALSDSLVQDDVKQVMPDADTPK